MPKIESIRLHAHGSRKYVIAIKWEKGTPTKTDPMTKAQAHKIWKVLKGCVG